jgi:hypothetical protein
MNHDQRKHPLNTLSFQMGTYSFTVIDAPWKTPRFTFEEMEDVQGPQLREKYWEQK